VTTKVEGDNIRMIFVNEVLFGSGSIRLTPKGTGILRVVAKELGKMSYGKIYVEGHTDIRPVMSHPLRRIMPTNWEFSVMRAARVARYLSNLGIKPTNIIAAGRGPYLPRNSNATPVGRAKNRRIEILITPDMEVKENRNRIFKQPKAKPQAGKDKKYSPPAED
jgi:chemotaxis protein MotB